jgi:chemosensory pili system protein ChpC
MSADKAATEIRGVLLPIQSGQLLLPNASVSEVASYLPPREAKGAPDWLLGHFSWRQLEVPLVSYERLLGFDMEPVGHRARVVVCKTLNGNAEIPFIGILLSAVPHLVRLTEEGISSVEGEDLQEKMIARTVMINDLQAWIPDLDGLERALQRAAG